MKKVIVVLALFLAGFPIQPAFTQQQTQVPVSSPCTATNENKPADIKLNPDAQKRADQIDRAGQIYSPVALPSIKDLLKRKPTAAKPCPPTAPQATVIAPVLKPVPGMTLIIRCSPEILAADGSTGYFTPNEITVINPTVPVTFAADVQAWKKGAVSCASVHKDSHGQYWIQNQ